MYGRIQGLTITVFSARGLVMCSTLSQLPPPGFRVKYSPEILWSWKIAESQGQFYSAVDLGELAAELDTMERRRMAEVT